MKKYFNSRKTKLFTLALAVVLLAGGVWVARVGLTTLTSARYQHAQAKARLVHAQGLVAPAAKREQFGEVSKQLQMQMNQSGFHSANWVQQRILRTPVELTRKETQEQLVRIAAPGEERLMLVEGFELTALSVDAGLFNLPSPDDRGILFAVNGTLYFPLRTKK